MDKILSTKFATYTPGGLSLYTLNTLCCYFQAYSLFGILSVNIDIRYGEGSKAFARPQDALIDTSTDESIFAREYSTNDADRAA